MKIRQMEMKQMNIVPKVWGCGCDGVGERGGLRKVTDRYSYVVVDIYFFFSPKRNKSHPNPYLGNLFQNSPFQYASSPPPLVFFKVFFKIWARRQGCCVSSPDNPGDDRISYRIFSRSWARHFRTAEAPSRTPGSRLQARYRALDPSN